MELEDRVGTTGRPDGDVPGPDAPSSFPDALRALGRARATPYVVAALVPLSWLVVVRVPVRGLGDLAAVATPAIAAAAVGTLGVLAVMRRSWVPVVAAVSTVVVAAGIVVGPRRPIDMDPPTSPITLAAVNLRFDNTDPLGSVDAVLARSPDVVVVSEGVWTTLRALSESYEYRVIARQIPGQSFVQAVFSRYPLEELDEEEPTRALTVRVDGPVPFTLIAAHPPRPSLRPDGSGRVSFRQHHDLVDLLSTDVEQAEGPVVLAGDLNLSDRTRGYRELTGQLRDAMREGWARSTFVGGPYRWLGLRIDHILIDPTWCADDSETFVMPGSDHRGVIAAIGPCP